MTSSPEEKPAGYILDLMLDMTSRISPHIEHIKFLRGHGEHEGWQMTPDKEGINRFQCGCGDWLDDKEEADNAGPERR